ncbi:MAG: helix-turn-helix domain-containing protein [Leptolyngbyaceae cyanobacterium]
MPRHAAPPIHLSDSERAELEKLVKRPSTAQQIALRGQIILRASHGISQGQFARELGISEEMSRRWRRHWLALSESALPVQERLAEARRVPVPLRPLP